MEKKILFLKGILSLFLVLLFCVTIPTEAEAATKLNTKSVTILKNKTYVIKLSGTKKKATWKTSKSSVARFVAKNNTAVKVKATKTGKSVVSAKVGNKTYKCTVTVVDPKLSKTKLTVRVGNTSALKVTGGSGKITWKSGNTSIAAINAKGTVTAKKAGTVKVTATQNKKKLTCVITVQEKRSKKVWVVTKPAWTEYVPVYEYTYYFECTTCGALFNSKTEADEHKEHQKNHLFNGVAAGWRDKVERKLLYTEKIEYPEEGYWKTIYY